MIDYRKIWEDNYGKIPKDRYGRSYEIHHIDGNRDNNSLDNLICVSIEEHFNIHYNNGDFSACQIIATRANKDVDVISELARQNMLRRIEEGYETAFMTMTTEERREQALKQHAKKTKEERKAIARKGVITREARGWKPKEGPRRKAKCTHCGDMIASNNLWRHEKKCSTLASI